MRESRYVVWISLWEVLQTIDPSYLIPGSQWDGLIFLISERWLEEGSDEQKANWTNVREMVLAIDGSHRLASRTEWNALYNLLDARWRHEREHDATSQELAAHAKARTKFPQ